MYHRGERAIGETDRRRCIDGETTTEYGCAGSVYLAVATHAAHCDAQGIGGGKVTAHHQRLAGRNGQGAGIAEIATDSDGTHAEAAPRQHCNRTGQTGTIRQVQSATIYGSSAGVGIVCCHHHRPTGDHHAAAAADRIGNGDDIRAIEGERAVVAHHHHQCTAGAAVADLQRRAAVDGGTATIGVGTDQRHHAGSSGDQRTAAVDRIGNGDGIRAIEGERAVVGHRTAAQCAAGAAVADLQRGGAVDGGGTAMAGTGDNGRAGAAERQMAATGESAGEDVGVPPVVDGATAGAHRDRTGTGEVRGRQQRAPVQGERAPGRTERAVGGDAERALFDDPRRRRGSGIDQGPSADPGLGEILEALELCGISNRGDIEAAVGAAAQRERVAAVGATASADHVADEGPAGQDHQFVATARQRYRIGPRYAIPVQPAADDAAVGNGRIAGGNDPGTTRPRCARKRIARSKITATDGTTGTAVAAGQLSAIAQGKTRPGHCSGTGSARTTRSAVL
ncbi:hypothetical protein [Thauera humireducens]|uniref:hypothetical protein n=1 Tax=Thauera humireducens TaxID=1134435 RepID=UPI00311F888B